MKLSIVLILAIMSLQAQELKQSDKHFWNTVETTASAEDIWSIWIDVNNWKTWDIGLKDAKMNEAFTISAKGKIISLEDKKSKFKVVEFEERKSYTFKTKLPLGSLNIKRSLEVIDGKTYFTHEVWFKGLTGGLFAKSFGKKFREMLPFAMQNIKNLAEKK